MADDTTHVPVKLVKQPFYSKKLVWAIVVVLFVLFTVGTDDKLGLYDIPANNGESGNLETSEGVKEILGGEYGGPEVTLAVMNNQEIHISSIDSVLFTKL